MAQNSGFFNAVRTDGVPDRTYNANDYCDNLAAVISNGVMRSDNNDLKVTADGMTVNVAVGRAWINGHYYYNDSVYTFPAVSAPTGGYRWDRVMLRLDTNLSARKISLVYVQGTAPSSPSKPAPTRTNTIYDLVLADVQVSANASKVTVIDTRADKSVCGWIYSTTGDQSFLKSLDSSFYEWFNAAKNDLASVTLFKRYIWRNKLTATTKTVQFDIPQYDAETCFFEVYVNGILEAENTDYTASGNILTFTNTLAAGTEVTVNCYKSIDGTGITSVADEITELQNKVATLGAVGEYVYKCTGLNDNISLSQIAQALYTGTYTEADLTTAAKAFLDGMGGLTAVQALSADCQITINVVGSCNVRQPFSGSGLSTARYKYFTLGIDNKSDKRIIFDFKNCDKIKITGLSNTESIIFYGTDLYIKNADVYASCYETGCTFDMIAGRYNTGNISVENSKFKILTTGRATIAGNGTFINCDTWCSSSNNHALNFVPRTDSLIRIYGGTHYAYKAGQANTAAIFYTYGTDPNAVVMAFGINCPKKAIDNFYQEYLSIANGGKTFIHGVTTTLSTGGTGNMITGIIAIEKPV